MADPTVLEVYRREITPELYREIRELYKTHSSAEDARDLPGLISTLTPDCVYELVQTGHRWEGHAGATRFYTELLTAFPDIQFDLTDIVIGPQGVCEEANVTATHAADWLGVPPTGERLEWKVRAIAIPAAVALAVAFHAWPLGHALQRTFLSMIVHELGHATTAWWCGFGALPGLWKTLVPETRAMEHIERNRIRMSSGTAIEDELWLRIDETRDEPRGRDPVDSRTRASDPSSFLIFRFGSAASLCRIRLRSGLFRLH